MCFIAEEEFAIIAEATPPEARIPAAVATVRRDRARRRGCLGRRTVECRVGPSVARNQPSLLITRAA
jgi:hypothetical protein